MKQIRYSVVATCSILASLSFAQGTDQPLLLHGFDQRVLNDVRSRGMGGAVIASGTSASALFANPAGLTNVGAFELRVAAINNSTSQDQRQEWVPNRYWTGLSLMMEDKWGDIKAPITTDPYEQLQKPFDAIGPNWSRRDKQTLPLSVALAIPVELAEIPFVFGVGASRAIDLDHYFQNNNVLRVLPGQRWPEQLLGEYRPQPLPELQPSDTLRARWFQFARKREGEIWGVTPAVAFSFSGFRIGASATYYRGTSSEEEAQLSRGFLTFLYNRFRVQDTVKYTSARAGSSTYKGLSGVVGVKFEQPKFSLAATFQLPYTLERTYSGNFHSQEYVLINRARDSSKTTVVNVDESGTDKIFFPLSYSFGLQLKPFAKWSVAFDYDIRRLDRVEYRYANGMIRQPWIAAPSIRLGAEYEMSDWLALRAGYREVSQSFSPDGSAIIGDPAVMSVVSAGAGISVYGIQIEAAYEYARLRYQDVWQSNVNYNSLIQHRVMLEFGYHSIGETN